MAYPFEGLVLLEAVTPQGALLSEIQQINSSSTTTTTSSSSSITTTSGSKGLRAATEAQEGAQGEGGRGGAWVYDVSQDTLKQREAGADRDNDLTGARDQGPVLGEMSRVVNSSKQKEQQQQQQEQQQQQVILMQQGLDQLRLEELSAAKQQPVPPSSLQVLAEQLGVLAVPTLTGTLPELLQRFQETSTEGKRVSGKPQVQAHMRWGSSDSLYDVYGHCMDGSSRDPLLRWKEMRDAIIEQHSNSSSSCSRGSLCVPTSEGWVVQEHATQQRHKLIMPAFKRVSNAGRLLHPLSVWDAVRNTGASAAELSAGLPPHYRKELQAILDALQEQYNGAWQQLQEVVGLANSSAEAMQLLVEEMHATEQQQTREPLQGVITGAYIPTGVPVPATLEAARVYGYVFEVMGRKGGVAREERRGLESASALLQTHMAGLHLEEFVAHKADSLVSESRSSSQTAGQGVLAMGGDGGQCAAVQGRCVGIQGREQTEAAAAAAGGTADNAALSNSTSISHSAITGMITSSRSRVASCSEGNNPSGTVPHTSSQTIAPAGEAITATTSTTIPCTSSSSGSALQNPAFRSAVRYLLEHSDSAGSNVMPSMYLDHSSYVSNHRHRLLRSHLLACIPPTFDGQLPRYTPSASFKQTYCKGWAKGTTEGRLVSLPSYAAAPAFAATESSSSSSNNNNSRSSSSSSSNNRSSSSSSSSNNKNYSSRWSSSSAVLAASIPLISVLQDTLMVEVFRRLETKGVDEDVVPDCEKDKDKKDVTKTNAKDERFQSESNTDKADLILDKKDMVVPLLVCKAWRIIASDDHELKSRRAAAAAVVRAARESMAQERVVNSRSRSYYDADSDGTYGWGGYGGYQGPWEGVGGYGSF